METELQGQSWLCLAGALDIMESIAFSLDDFRASSLGLAKPQAKVVAR